MARRKYLSMKPEYQEWISKNYPDPAYTLGRCKEAVDAMVEVFPELTKTNGFIDLLSSYDRMHWWCKDAEGNIVDPTAHQFRAYADVIIDYREIDDSHPARKYPRAKCMNCGEYYYVTPELKGILHTPKCDKEFISYLNNGD